MFTQSVTLYDPARACLPSGHGCCNIVTDEEPV